MKKVSIFERAFTLIELLVVVSIISMLSTVVFASLKNARDKARDSKKISHLVQIRTALELYRSVNNAYPGAGSVNSNCAISSPYMSGTLVSTTNWIPGLVPQFYPKLPGATPLPYVGGSKGRGNECYIYYSNGADYKLTLMGGLDVTCADYSVGGFCGNSIISSAQAYSATIYSANGVSFELSSTGL